MRIVTETSRLADPPARRLPALRSSRRFLAGMLASTALVAACGQGPGAGDDRGTSTPTVDESDSTLSSSLAAYNGTPIGGRFIDADRGAVVRTLCTEDGCRYQLLTTADGGVHWQMADVPGPPVLSAPLDDAYAAVLPSGEVITEIQVDDDRPARHTTDGGKTWPAQSAAPKGITTHVPANGVLVDWCAASVTCVEPLLRVIGPGGDSASFGPPPAQLSETISAGRVAEGSLWIQGRDGVGRILFAVSRDDGAHWTVTRVPVAAAATVEIVGAGEVAWALSLTDPASAGGTGGTVPVERGRMLRQSLLYSANSGASFELVKLPEDYRLNTGSGIGITESGDAVISSDGKIAVVSPEGDVTAVKDVRGAVCDLGSRTLVYGSTGSWVSTDGENWRALPKV